MHTDHRTDRGLTDRTSEPPMPTGTTGGRHRRRLLAGASLVGLAAITAGIVGTVGGSPSAAAHGGHTMRQADQEQAMRATAQYQDVEVAEAAGWTSTIETLGCFQDPLRGGMGEHHVNGSLMDAVVDPTKPEGLVYELDVDGNVAGLVAHEYIVPVDAWTSNEVPRLFGMAFHRHSTLPLWVLHTWLWKPNPSGVFADWNPAVRPCPSGVPIFGVDLPK
jgi:hypothetical protein